MRNAVSSYNSDRAFLMLLTPLTAASVPSLVFCALELALRLHTSLASTTSPNLSSGWDSLLSLQDSAYLWIAQWNSLTTLAATGFLISALVRPRWRQWTGLALIPYGVLLCADFTLRLRSVLMP